MGSTEQEVAQFNRAWNDKYSNKYSIMHADPFLNEAPQLTVDLVTYSIDQYKVTNARYRRCVESGECTPPPQNLPRLFEYFANSQYDYYPARVTWNDAYTYCQWVGKRLPSEGEWEKAARGTDGRLYPWGNVLDLTRYNNNPDQYEPVNQYPQGRSPYGVVGMLDRPAEWTIDQYFPYPGNSAVYPGRDTSNGELNNAYARGYRVVRGGGYPDERARVSYREFADFQSEYLSFRCVQGPTVASLEEVVVHTTAPTPVPTLMSTSAVDLSRMVYIPAGEFVMGTNESSSEFDFGDARPEHITYLNAFYIDRTEVTVREYVAFLNNLGTQHRACEGFDCGGAGGMVFDPPSNRYIVVDRYDVTIGKWVEGTRYSKYPIVEVSWYGADAYCRWVGKRLPTEAEWEKAARGTDGRRYPWGNEPVEYFFTTLRHEVGTWVGDVSPYGVFDMLGNAREWTSDWYAADYYSHSPYFDPQGPTSGGYKVIRGAGQRLGIQIRTRYLPDQTYEAGFRCAYTPH